MDNQLNIIDEDINPKERPFFSAIVSCYNSDPNKIKELLDSIYDAGMPTRTEIIIADDRSDNKEYLEIVTKYKNKFSDIILTDVPNKCDDGTELIHCPGNTKETGARVATGEWITFIDHDDIFAENAFKIVYDAILESKEQYVVNTIALEINPETNEIIRSMDHALNWMHGKFYNLDNFWNKYNFHFPTNLQSHEDIAISSMTLCKIHELKNEEHFWVDEYTYKWRAWKDSTSRSHYLNNNKNNETFLEFYFYDYIKSTLGVYLENFDSLSKENKLTDENIKFYIRMYIDVILYMYFYIQSFKFNRGLTFNIEREYVVKQHIKNFYSKFDVDPSFIYRLVSENKAIWYNAIRENAIVATGFFIEIDSFIDFISK